MVNGHRQVGRRRLAFAPELGHYLFADEYIVDWRIAETDDSGAWESRLDRFARAVLLPATGLTGRWNELRANGDDLRAAERHRMILRPALALLCDAVRGGLLTVPLVSALADDLLASQYRLPFVPGGFAAWAEQNGQLR